MATGKKAKWLTRFKIDDHLFIGITEPGSIDKGADRFAVALPKPPDLKKRLGGVVDCGFGADYLSTMTPP